jgi:DMSO/TMAO reductase YedYZ molybdopterin-dependent catalytic subunit
MAREFSRSQISAKPLQNEVAPLGDEFKRLQTAEFADWQLKVDGLVANPRSFSLAELRSFPRRSHVTMIQCEEGWSYIAEWTGVPLSHVLQVVGASEQATHVVYRSVQPDWWESMDMADALHPQTLLAHEMNGGSLPVGFGGPLRMRVTRQLGYKSLKYVTSLTVTDNIKQFGKGLGSAEPESGYSWYAGI